MTEDQPSEAALRKACEVLECLVHVYMQKGYDGDTLLMITNLARHFDAEDKAARAARDRGEVWSFARRHILPDPKPTLRSILLDESLNVEGKERAIRDAGLLREEAP